VNATLSCRLVLTNHASHALTDLALSGDMTSAHASRPWMNSLAWPARNCRRCARWNGSILARA
jgi:hypothetical protein